MKIIRELEPTLFEVRTKEDAMLIGSYYKKPKWHRYGYWWGSAGVMIADDNKFEGL